MSGSHSAPAEETELDMSTTQVPDSLTPNASTPAVQRRSVATVLAVV